MGREETRTIEESGSQTREIVHEPPLYQVVLLNDDYTTMDFVIHVLETVFHKAPAEAMRIMLHVHKNGKGMCGLFPMEIAEMKVSAVHALAREHRFPLKCVMEKE
ncbi:MAG TPA: ATP-dependent Clp protease adapter ClpS [Dissulfurispiraceae bacterium]|nr:ATP-dependent Clp protease adapter ClpS [Dissulfurispiraceae bacterium]